MRFNATIQLLTTVYVKDHLRNEIPITQARLVYANLRRTSLQDKLAAGVDNLKAVQTFEIMSLEYNDEEKLMYEGDEYEVIDAQVRGDRTVLLARKIRRGYEN